MTKVQKLCNLVKEKFDLDLDPSTFRRTRAGYWQRSKGAWSWSMNVRDSALSYGSQSSVTQILKMWTTSEIWRDEILISNL